MYHWDLPQILHDKYKGLLNTELFARDFTFYSKTLFKIFGHKVKYWITFNEPVTQCLGGYAIGQHAPGRGMNPFKDEFGVAPLDILRCAHSVLVAHAHAVRALREDYPRQKSKISMANHFAWGEPVTNSSADAKAAQLFIDFQFGWFNEPLLTGNYPASLRSMFRMVMPRFTPEESAMLRGSTDFVGLNHYTTNYIGHWGYTGFDSDRGNVLMQFARTHYNAEGVHIGTQGNADWIYSVPWGFTKTLKYIRDNYDNPEIYVTEIGFSVKDEQKMTRTEARHDAERVNYFRTYLAAMQEAMRAGCNVKGFMAWSILV
jgi:beta-glucosidase